VRDADRSPATAKGGIVSRAQLVERLAAAARVVIVSAPAGSGKTFLLRSWIAEAGLSDSAAWVAVTRARLDPQSFWISVLDALRGTAAGARLIRELTPAPGVDGATIAERVLEDLSSLEDPLWLVIDDAHELGSSEALRQLSLFSMRAPDRLRLVLSTRLDLRLGLHRLRLEGDLTEIRADDLRFSVDEARALFEAAGTELSESALALLHARTEGWAAGLRLAALSLPGQEDPKRFAAEFSGSTRIVAEYLVDEVLDQLQDDVRQLLLRTSVLERVNGPLADLLTGGSGGERILDELERANAFVMSLDAQRSWFRYHHLFSDLLQVWLRREAPGDVGALHRRAAGWLAEHGHAIEAVRHAQAGEDWGLAMRLLSDSRMGLWLDGAGATAHELLVRFPPHVVAADAELAALTVADELERGSLEQAGRQLVVAGRLSESTTEERRVRVQNMLAGLRLRLARQRGDLPKVVEEARQLLTGAELADATRSGLEEERRAVWLLSLGIAEVWTARFRDAERHLEEALALARRTGRPYIAIECLANRALLASFGSFKPDSSRAWRPCGWPQTTAGGMSPSSRSRTRCSA
jgi:LuxR family transcriptional regulator, maltose regulon positive regulatory protein